MTTDAILPLNVVLPIIAVNVSFPEVTQTASTGANTGAIGNPIATRSVIYANGDGSKKITITVDEYGSAGDAQSAFQQAQQGSEAVSGFSPISETGGRDAFENGGGVIQLHPDFGPHEARVAMVWDSFGFAPLIGDGILLERVRAMLRLQCDLLRHSQVPAVVEAVS
jgi:hypothetical protein